MLIQVSQLFFEDFLSHSLHTSDLIEHAEVAE